jgi:hypothetical protein
MGTTDGTRATVIERVTTPLGFFTLGILVIEAILATLSLRASGYDLTILILGMLLGFLVLCAMVFVLTIHPTFRHALLGNADDLSFSDIQAMSLSFNDVRVLFAAGNPSGLTFIEIEPDLVTVQPGISMDQRIERFRTLGLAQPSRYRRVDLTPRGVQLSQLIRQFAEPMLHRGDKISS